MRHAAIVVSWVLLVMGASPASAAGVYTCREAGGSNVYQDVPCKVGQESVSHRAIDAPLPSGEESSQDRSAQARPSQRRPVRRTGQRARREAGPSERVIAFECRERGRSWTQAQPCTTRPLDVSTSSGRRAAGAGAGARISERKLERDDLCERVRDGTYRDPAGTRPSDDVYQRNLLRDRGC
jgi:hypothetical protein